MPVVVVTCSAVECALHVRLAYMRMSFENIPPLSAGGARAGAPPPPPLPGKGALGKRPPGQAAPNQSRPSAPNRAALVAGPTPSKPMVKLFWDKLPDKQVSLQFLSRGFLVLTGGVLQLRSHINHDPRPGTEQKSVGSEVCCQRAAVQVLSAEAA